MRPSSMDRRERIAAAVDHHEGSIRRIAEDHGGQVPDTMDRLTAFRGVGPKIAETIVSAAAADDGFATMAALTPPAPRAAMNIFHPSIAR